MKEDELCVVHEDLSSFPIQENWLHLTKSTDHKKMEKMSNIPNNAPYTAFDTLGFHTCYDCAWLATVYGLPSLDTNRPTIAIA